MRPEEQRPDQQPDEITDLPIREVTDASDAADTIKGGAGTTTTLSNVTKSQNDTTSSIVGNLKA